MSKNYFLKKALDKSERMFYNMITRNRTLVLEAVLTRVQRHAARASFFLNKGANHDTTHQKLHQQPRYGKQRITELSKLRRTLLKRGDIRRVAELDLDRRIQLLYEEHGEMQAIISHLTSYNRRRESFEK